MPIVPGFRNDLFVSYAHANNMPWRRANRAGSLRSFKS